MLSDAWLLARPWFAHVPSVIRSFVYTWKSLFKSGLVDHQLKELLRLRVARSLDCAY